MGKINWQITRTAQNVKQTSEFCQTVDNFSIYAIPLHALGDISG